MPPAPARPRAAELCGVRLRVCVCVGVGVGVCVCACACVCVCVRARARWEREKLDLEAELRRQKADMRARLEEAVRYHTDVRPPSLLMQQYNYIIL